MRVKLISEVFYEFLNQVRRRLALGLVACLV